METAVEYWGYLGILEKNMELTIQGLGFTGLRTWRG